MQYAHVCTDLMFLVSFSSGTTRGARDLFRSSFLRVKSECPTQVSSMILVLTETLYMHKTFYSQNTSCRRTMKNTYYAGNWFTRMFLGAYTGLPGVVSQISPGPQHYVPNLGQSSVSGAF